MAYCIRNRSFDSSQTMKFLFWTSLPNDIDYSSREWFLRLVGWILLPSTPRCRTNRAVLELGMLSSWSTVICNCKHCSLHALYIIQIVANRFTIIGFLIINPLFCETFLWDYSYTSPYNNEKPRLACPRTITRYTDIQTIVFAMNWSLWRSRSSLQLVFMSSLHDFGHSGIVDNIKVTLESFAVHRRIYVHVATKTCKASSPLP